jgi:hypothetical protein
MSLVKSIPDGLPSLRVQLVRAGDAVGLGVKVEDVALRVRAGADEPALSGSEN